MGSQISPRATSDWLEIASVQTLFDKEFPTTRSSN